MGITDFINKSGRIIILVVGCGPGGLIPKLEEELKNMWRQLPHFKPENVTIIGIDTDSGNEYGESWKKLEARYNNVKFEKCGVEILSKVEDEKIALIEMHNVLHTSTWDTEHEYSWATEKGLTNLLENIHRVLIKGGLFRVTGMYREEGWRSFIDREVNKAVQSEKNKVKKHYEKMAKKCFEQFDILYNYLHEHYRMVTEYTWNRGSDSIVAERIIDIPDNRSYGLEAQK